MKVLAVEPGKVPYETEIEGGLESLQKAVGGSIEAVYPYEDPVAVICNEEGKLIGLPTNRALKDQLLLKLQSPLTPHQHHNMF